MITTIGDEELDTDVKSDIGGYPLSVEKEFENIFQTFSVTLSGSK